MVFILFPFNQIVYNKTRAVRSMEMSLLLFKLSILRDKLEAKSTDINLLEARLN